MDRRSRVSSVSARRRCRHARLAEGCRSAMAVAERTLGREHSCVSADFRLEGGCRRRPRPVLHDSRRVWVALCNLVVDQLLVSRFEPSAATAVVAGLGNRAGVSLARACALHGCMGADPHGVRCARPSLAEARARRRPFACAGDREVSKVYKVSKAYKTPRCGHGDLGIVDKRGGRRCRHRIQSTRWIELGLGQGRALGSTRVRRPRGRKRGSTPRVARRGGSNMAETR